MKRVLLFIIIFISQTGNSHGADDAILLTKFAGFKDGKGGVMGVFKKGSDGWATSNFRAYADSEMFKSQSNISNSCIINSLDSMFKQSQVFAVNKYLETGYVSKTEAQYDIAHSVDFTDRPISFFHYVSSEAPPGGVNEFANEEASFKFGFLKNSFIDPKIVPKDGYVRASLYSIAAQKIELGETAEAANLKLLDLPWSTDPEFKNFKFDRQKYPLVWEIGRAASTNNYEFPQLLGLAGQDILKDLMHYGVPDANLVDHSFVSFHAVNAENTEKFNKLFPGKIIAHGENDKNFNVFMVPLKEYLEKFKPERFSEAQKIMKETLGAGRSVAQNQAFIEAFKYSEYLPLDVRYKGKNLHTPIIFSSIPSGYASLPMDKLAEKFGVKMQDVEALFKKNSGNFSAQHISTDVAWPEKLVDPLVSHKITQFQGQSVFQIGNLDPVLAKSDPDYVISNLVAMFDHYARQFMPGNQTNPEMLQKLVLELKRNNVRFMLTTHYPETADAIKKLSPKQRISIDLAHDPHASVVWEEISKQSSGKIKRPSNEMQGFVFDLDQIGMFRYFVYQKNGMDPQRLTLIRPGFHWWLQGASEP